MRRHFSLKSTSIADTLNYPGYKSSAVEHTHFLGDADICIYERVVVGDHVFVWCFGGDGVFKGIGGSLEKEAPERSVDEMKEREDSEWTILNTSNPPLRISHHLRKQERERGPTQICLLTSVEMPVIYCFAV
ncbi:hypothetical protein TMatcc_003103 [Talaromyces marneffei ATCC 18224]